MWYIHIGGNCELEDGDNLMYQQEKGLIGWRAEVSAGDDINQQQSGRICRRRY
ncbi:hypothetical protein GLV94_02250 [Virgibacillus halodenitrificans]|uniref:hypothetical protein n=1 Tax=Virgibacillus halodenitrificans TaxID=1482 RepID=UPI00136BAA12|nr:hypothetical protein [Virgibacillus halodenitrificans]MYL44455.1 hypothetical protein [Virgibacillus halodenitrificans]